ncbi:DUF421 domain-containing protein [Leeuwenhoekiella sp. MAR_2009_132]|uniref:DUF421 domain-containing protein n=1 Tax=Leeuwenhoekiella sp. MAR_2009_132 TaxID=1392489 RepID=UPI00048E0B25|nr:YetF domain-containing protein [Leeuwenhoekiella sp. MAR_2009_132]
METWTFASASILIKVIISLLVIFSIIILITRISGLRTFAKMSSFDFASTIAIGSILATVVMNTNQSLLKGAIALGGIILFQTFFSFVIRKSKVMNKLLTNAPMMLMYEGKILYENLNKTNVGEDDLIAKLRESNALQLSEVRAVILESTGDMSVLHSSEKSTLDKKILQGVVGIPEYAKI